MQNQKQNQMTRTRLYDLVRKILTEQPQTRADDYLLFLAIVQDKFIATSISVYEMFTFHADYRLPSFESITRARRFVQKDYPELTDKEALEARRTRERTIRDYVRKRNAKQNHNTRIC
jgi:hypothetical protein